MYDTNRPAFLERDLVGLGVNDNWQVWVRYCGGEAVSIHMVREGMAVSTSINPPSSILAPVALIIFVSHFYSTAEEGNSV